MEQYGSILSREFEYFYAQRLDVRDLIDQSRSFATHIFPIIKLKRCISELLSWKNFIYSFFTLILGNLLILCTSNVVFLSSACLIFIVFIFFGMLHRRTGILKKVFPSDNLEEFINLPYNEAMHDLHTILVMVDSFVRCGCANMLKIYAILRWENLTHSILIYSLLFGACIILSTCPLRFFFLFVFNITFSICPLLYYISSQNIIVEEETNSQDILIEETLSRNSEQDAGFATDTESSVHESISSDEDREEERKSGFTVVGSSSNQEEPQAATMATTTVGEQITEAEIVEQNPSQILSEKATKVDTKIETKLVASTKVNALVGKILDLKKRRNILHSEKCSYCGQLYNTILKRKNICSSCGNHFCAKCCNFKVPRSKFGATAPAAQTETAPVCLPCYENLTQKNCKDD